MSLFDTGQTDSRRTLVFPEEFAVGTLYITDENSMCLAGCQTAEARGTVTLAVMPGEHLGLWVESTDYSFMTQLDADVLDWMHLEAPTDYTLPYVARLTGLTELIVTSFDFRESITDEGIARLMPLTRLRQLTLHDVAITDDTTEILLSFPQLTRLSLSYVNVSARGLKVLAKLANLEILELYNLPEVTDEAVSALSQMQSLIELKVRNTGISQTAIRRLSGLLKNCRISGAA